MNDATIIIAAVVIFPLVGVAMFLLWRMTYGVLSTRRDSERPKPKTEVIAWGTDATRTNPSVAGSTPAQASRQDDQSSTLMLMTAASLASGLASGATPPPGTSPAAPDPRDDPADARRRAPDHVPPGTDSGTGGHQPDGQRLKDLYSEPASPDLDHAPGPTPSTGGWSAPTGSGGGFDFGGGFDSGGGGGFDSGGGDGGGGGGGGD
jgi:hypothetical protein